MHDINSRLVSRTDSNVRSEQHSQSIVKLPAFFHSESLSLLCSVLMNSLTCGLHTFRKFSEIDFEKSGVHGAFAERARHRCRGSGGL
jgi:hypothetical protein